MWNPFRGREEKRAITSIPGYWPDYSEPSQQYGHVTVNRALSLTPVFAAVNFLANAISSFPLLLLKRDSRGIPQRQPTPALFSNPSVHGTPVDWVHRAVVSMALQGDGIGLITQRDFYNFPTMIEWLNPENVATHDGKLEGPGSYINPLWWWWGRPLDPANILHIPWFSMPWRVRGLSPIGAYQLTINRGIGAAEYGANWYASGGVPPGHFRNTAKTIEEKDATQLAARFTARLQSRKPLVTGADWEFTPIAIKPHEAVFVETERMTATQIAVIYQIPPERIGGTTGNNLTYQTVEQNTIDLLTFCLRPWMVKLEAALSNCFPRGYYVRFDPTDMLRVDAKTQAEIDQMSLGFNPPGWMDVDEVRANRDLPPMKRQTPDVLVPSRPTDGQPVNGNSSANGAAQRGLYVFDEQRGLSGREELARLNTMRARWSDALATKGN